MVVEQPLAGFRLKTEHPVYPAFHYPCGYARQRCAAGSSERLTAPDRAANIPEFVYTKPHAIEKINERFIDDVSLWRAGMAFEDAGDTDNALGKFTKALELNPQSVKAHISVGNILESRGNADEALKHYALAAHEDSSYAIARINVGNIYFKKGNMPEAMGSIRPRCALRLTMVTPSITWGRPTRSYRIITRRWSILSWRCFMPGDGLTRFELGKSYAGLGKTREAIILQTLPKRCASFPTIATATLSLPVR